MKDLYLTKDGIVTLEEITVPEISHYCSPNWHVEGKVPADYFVTVLVNDGFSNIVPAKTGVGKPVRFAACEEHLGRAISFLRQAHDEVSMDFRIMCVTPRPD